MQPTDRITLPNLVDRAKLAINCLTQHCDKSRGHLPYFYTRLSDRPLSAILATWSYGDGLGRAVDALTLLRTMTGDHIDHIEDKSMRATLLGLIGRDDLSWCPAEPWTLDVPHTRPAWLQQGTLLGLTSLWQYTGEQNYRNIAQQNILAVAGMSRYQELKKYADFPGDYYTMRDGWQNPPDDPNHRKSVFNTSITMPLMRFYRLTGFEPAIELASNLISWAIIDHDGIEGLFNRGHFHSYSRLMTAIILRGIIKNDTHDIEFGVRLFAKALTLGTQSGWFPEQINNTEHNRSNLSETCCLTDMLESAILLARHVDPQYWNHIERWANNHLLVHQITDSDWFDQTTFVPRSQHVLGFNCQKTIDVEGVREGDILKRTLIGGYAGWGAVTAMSDDSMFSNSNQQCCNAAGARGLYDVWRYAVTDDDTTLKVNLHINRRHQCADIAVAVNQEECFLSFHISKPRKLLVRIPEFIKPREMIVKINKKMYEVEPNNGYISMGKLVPCDKVEIVYPCKVYSTTERVASGEFTFEWRGTHVIKATPLQKIHPLFIDTRFEQARDRDDVRVIVKEIESI